MLNEIIKTAEELNTAALYYRQSGNMDGVRELAKAHAVSKTDRGIYSGQPLPAG